MKRIIMILSAIMAAGFGVAAQDIVIPEGYEYVDSVIYIPVSAVDRSLEGRDIYSVLPPQVTVSQTESMRQALENHIGKNSEKQYSGYRIRIYFDNKQVSRSESESEMARFKAKYPGIQAYRSYSNPFFKVTVGDFRTKAEAQELLKEIQRDFPAAFVVREKFRYPVLEAGSYQTDTVRYLRPIDG